MAKGIIRKALRIARPLVESAIVPRRSEGHVLVLHTGRSGSTLLGDMLDQHPDVFWDGEVLEKMLHRLARKQSVGIDALFGTLTAEQAFDEITTRQRWFAGGKVFGIEIQDYHLDFFGIDIATLVARLRPLGFTRFVILDRRDQLRKVTSHVLAQERGFHHLSAPRADLKKRVHLSIDRIYAGHRFRSLDDVLESYSEFFVNAREELRDDGVLQLEYETHVESDPLNAYALICRHIGVEPQAPEIKFVKTAPQPLSELLENHDEVVAFLASRRPEQRKTGSRSAAG